MKLILNLDDKIVSNMQGYCEQHGITVNELVESLFNKHIQEPATIIDELYQEEGTLDELNEFAELLTHYLNEATYDIESSSLSDEAYATDTPMAEVFKLLIQAVVKEPRNITMLYKKYKEVVS